MDYEIRYVQKDTYLHAIVNGRNTRENVLASLAEITLECDRRQCHRILVEERLEGPRLQTLDVFAIASEGSLQALGKFEAIAYVDVYAGELMEFAEDVAVNRGIPVAVFGNVEDAERWIAKHQRVDDPAVSDNPTHG